MFEDKEVTGDGPMEGTAGPDSAQICGTSDPINLYLAAKNLVEAVGFMVLVYTVHAGHSRKNNFFFIKFVYSDILKILWDA